MSHVEFDEFGVTVTASKVYERMRLTSRMMD